MTDPRWQVKVKIRTPIGPTYKIYDLVEIEHMSASIEPGPHWNEIISIEATRLSQNMDVTMTIGDSPQQ